MEKKYKIKSEVMDSQAIARTLTRMAHEIIEKNKGAKNLVIIGIRKRGDIIARRLAEIIKKIEGIDIPVGVIDITLYRDDYDLAKSKKEISGSDIPFSIDGKDVIMVDDVLFAGRTARAGMDVLIEYGRPKTIQLAVLIDRGHRELPIQANYIGKSIPTSLNEEIIVTIGEQKEKVLLVEIEKK